MPELWRAGAADACGKRACPTGTADPSERPPPPPGAAPLTQIAAISVVLVANVRVARPALPTPIVRSPARSRAPQGRRMRDTVAFQVFNPEKFKDLAGRLAQTYALSGQPPLVLKAYLAIMSKDEFEFGNKLGGRFAMADYDDRAALTQGSLKSASALSRAHVRTPVVAPSHAVCSMPCQVQRRRRARRRHAGLVSTFGMETVVLYNALMLKKRVAIYSSNVDTLQTAVRYATRPSDRRRVMRSTRRRGRSRLTPRKETHAGLRAAAVPRTLPILAWHRLNWSIVRPLVDLEDEGEVAQLSNQLVYIAGFLDRAIVTREDLYDIFVDSTGRAASRTPGAVGPKWTSRSPAR